MTPGWLIVVWLRSRFDSSIAGRHGRWGTRWESECETERFAICVIEVSEGF